MPKFFEVHAGATEKKKTLLSRSSTGRILTLPDPVHVENVTALGTDEREMSSKAAEPPGRRTEEAEANTYRSAVGLSSA